MLPGFCDGSESDLRATLFWSAKGNCGSQHLLVHGGKRRTATSFCPQWGAKNGGILFPPRCREGALAPSVGEGFAGWEGTNRGADPTGGGGPGRGVGVGCELETWVYLPRAGVFATLSPWAGL